jgi:hypothetical protein
VAAFVSAARRGREGKTKDESGKMKISEYGAIGYHWKGRRWFVKWFVNLYIWRRGPWRLSWRWNRRIGSVETPMLNNALSRAVTDVLWGLQRKKDAL